MNRSLLAGLVALAALAPLSLAQAQARKLAAVPVRSANCSDSTWRSWSVPSAPDLATT